MSYRREEDIAAARTRRRGRRTVVAEYIRDLKPDEYLFTNGKGQQLTR